MLGELLLDRVSPLIANSIWPLLEKYATPLDLVSAQAEAFAVLSWIGRQERLATVVPLAEELGSRTFLADGEIEQLVAKRLLPQSIADLAQLAGSEGEEPVVVTSGALRVATRMQRNSLGRKNRNSAGRIAIARLVGYGSDARCAQLALLELGTDVCQPTRPKCSECPLSSWCLSAADYTD